MRSRFTLEVLVALLLSGAAPVGAQELFRLVVDPGAATPFSDKTGRHGIATGGVVDIDPGPPVVPGSVVATSVLSPDGANAALFMGGWLDITTGDPAFASDFVLPGNQRRTISFWFKSAGNGGYDPTPALGRYADRMHALGFGTDVNNFDVDFGDDDLAGAFESACWTYWDGGGDINVVETNSHDRNFYLDDQWHQYILVRGSGLVTVYMDGSLLGTNAYSSPLGSPSSEARNYIGRGSRLADPPVVLEDPFPWFGYIASFSVVQEPDTRPPTLSCPPSIVIIDSKFSPPGEVVFFSGTATDDIDPAPSVICVPPSGSFFHPGKTMVTCTATDASGNQSVCTFSVFVMPSMRRP